MLLKTGFKNAAGIFRNKKVITVNELSDFLKCSVPAARNRFKEWNTYTSFNKNGRYYVLPEIPKFDQYGIWKFRNICFSKYGNLKKTLIHIVNESQAGLSAFDMSEILCMPAHKFLSHFKTYQGFEREKYNGIYIYFSKEREVYEKQKKERQKINHSKAESDLPSDGDSVIILAELIKHLKDTVQQLTRRVRRRGINVSIEKVRNLLVYHDLLKKTQDFQSFGH